MRRLRPLREEPMWPNLGERGPTEGKHFQPREATLPKTPKTKIREIIQNHLSKHKSQTQKTKAAKRASQIRRTK